MTSQTHVSVDLSGFLIIFNFFYFMAPVAFIKRGQESLEDVQERVAGRESNLRLRMGHLRTLNH